jgi:hypothetical protein
MKRRLTSNEPGGSIAVAIVASCVPGRWVVSRHGAFGENLRLINKQPARL